MFYYMLYMCTPEDTHTHKYTQMLHVRNVLASLKINLHVLETGCFYRISPIPKHQLQNEIEYEIHRRNSLSNISICKQRMHLFHMSENRFSFLGGSPDVV